MRRLRRLAVCVSILGALTIAGPAPIALAAGPEPQLTATLDGKPIPNLGGGATQILLSAASQDVVVQRSFSNKPKVTGKFENFFDKIEHYVGVICGPAIALHGANRGQASHTFLLEGTGGETLGVLTLSPWRQGDLVLLELPAGTYRLHDPAVPGSDLSLRVIGDG